MEEIINEAKKIAGTMELDLYATDEELKGMDQEEYYQKGIQKGIIDTKQEMVINMYNDKVSLESITKYANLSLKEVEDIINNNIR